MVYLARYICMYMMNVTVHAVCASEQNKLHKSLYLYTTYKNGMIHSMLSAMPAQDER